MNIFIDGIKTAWHIVYAAMLNRKQELLKKYEFLVWSAADREALNKRLTDKFGIAA